MAATVACFLITLAAFGQVTTGSLTGTVTSTGNPLPGVTITVSSPNLQGTRTTVTDANGNYNLSALPPGEYTVRFELAGLQTVTQRARVGVTQTARADADLKVSSLAEAITVTANAPAVLETTEVQTNVPAKLVENLPMGRTLIATVNLAPGVNQNGPGGNTMISGGQSFDSTFYVDGAVVNELLRGQPQNLFIEDALQETTVQTGAISAEFGHFTGGVVTSVSKSGGNSFTGSFRDTITNPSWTTKGELAKVDSTDKMIHNYEGTLGGRIIRDRLWFFTAGRYNKLDYARRFGRTPTDTTDSTFQFGDKERRLELKLTGQITSAHSLSGSYFDIHRTQKNNPFGTPLEASALDVSRSLPNRFYTLDYNGILTNNFLIEALYAKQIFKFVDSGADAPAPPERGTNIFYPLVGTAGSFAGYNTFCGGCAPFPESRNNENAKVKGNYFLSSKSVGTHNLVAGFENYKDMLKSDNYQSASSFTLYTYDSPSRAADGTFLNSLTAASGFLIWFPILESSHGNEFTTRSFFFNDKWDLTQNLNFNLGVRYDNNEGVNEARAKVASDSKVSPRVAATYDVFGNGRLRLNASYSQYVSKIANGNVGDITSSAGSPSYLYWLYYGPDLNNLPTNQFLDQVYKWFNSVGGTKNTDFLLGGGTAGISPAIRDKLKSPSVDEFTVGFGTQIGRNGFIRADYQNRKWSDFYTQIANRSTGTVFDPLAAGTGADVDLKLVTNSNDFTRKYNAFLVQGGYRLLNRVDLGGNYTYSKLRGNITGENSGGGPFVSNGTQYFPEFRSYARANPIGYLGADQRHKVRAWASIDFPTFIGNFNVSALQRYDSGVPYGANGNIWLVRGSQCATCPTNNPAQGGPGYTAFNINAFTTGGYWFTSRDAFRTDNITATDLALNYFVPIGPTQLFVEGKVFNVFNRQGVANVNTTVRTAVNSSCRQTVGPNAGKRCVSFNPFTETPVEGVNWVKGPNFGKPLNPTTGEPFGGAGDFQTPRTYRVSLGIRF
ncbi:MAG TPA: carboxypeptidase regulatory-like domain-containing protein [Thermoanaerobaculia bacterium]